ncbi:hypothetical protein AU091_gp43 [Rhodococcus phage CosmicSans]|uniref:Uncharacterized protein n=1 Tax=Rhodococcus phage CosmicSans TaxID=1701851 RepID=A0A0K2CLQ4_9CAUD|nr:hypothetical protein AU091_gp43 [Rhodococcus phage CosmicSans]ALA06477.1 hypothetical protein SEA_COSMICSANS_30 [Rhodococcus phage CosmicSans]ALA46233.1 hypothetical protein PBI_RHODALYSA_30 [Rhodococcus phage Rhodalysa]ALO80628.1 hypothetical protein SEA_LILLIE_30 [Rhodococcus phage Lillie]
MPEHHGQVPDCQLDERGSGGDRAGDRIATRQEPSVCHVAGNGCQGSEDQQHPGVDPSGACLGGCGCDGGDDHQTVHDQWHHPSLAGWNVVLYRQLFERGERQGERESCYRNRSRYCEVGGGEPFLLQRYALHCTWPFQVFRPSLDRTPVGGSFFVCLANLAQL